MRRVLTLAPLLLLACKGPAAGDDTGDTDRDTGLEGSGGKALCSPVMNLEIVPLDIWGRDADDAVITFSREPVYANDPDAAPASVMVPLGLDPTDLTVFVHHPELDATGVTVAFSGGGNPDAFRLDQPTNAGRMVTSFEERRLEGFTCPVFSVYLGMDHPWYAASGRAPTYNEVELYINGETFWADVYTDMERAEQRVFWSTWWWQSDFELLRPSNHYTLTEAQRKQSTVMSVFEDLPGVERRILVNRFWGENTDFTLYLNTDSTLRAYAEDDDDNLEVVLQGNDAQVSLTREYDEPEASWYFGPRVLENPRYAQVELLDNDARGESRDLVLDAASWHQKAAVIDGKVAYISGMNTKGTDWDSEEHRVFDERRMDFDADQGERTEVRDREELPSNGPRRDYGARLEGPAARQVEQLMQLRWDRAIATHAAYSDNASPFQLDGPAAEGNVPVQVVATMPGPWAERSILETHRKAIRKATGLIFIEDQYFRAPLLNEAILDRMLQVPDLYLIVISKPVLDADGGAKFTYLSDATFRELFPDRYQYLQLRAVDLVTEEGIVWDDVDLYVEDIDTHSKLRFIDDQYVSLGSCNMNNRGYLYEGELNIATAHVPTVQAFRRRVFENLVGPDYHSALSEQPRLIFALFRDLAEYNQEVLDWWEANGDDLDADEAETAWRQTHPYGFLYPLQQGRGYLFDTGPDAF